LPVKRRRLFTLIAVLLSLCPAAVADISTEDVQVLDRQAREGDSQAQYYLGVVFYEGIHREKNWVSASEWVYASAMQGHPDAAYQVGRMTYLGEAFNQDTALGLEWMTYAARLGHPKAAEFLRQLALRSDREYSTGSEAGIPPAEPDPEVDDESGDNPAVEQAEALPTPRQMSAARIELNYRSRKYLDESTEYPAATKLKIWRDFVAEFGRSKYAGFAQGRIDSWETISAEEDAQMRSQGFGTIESLQKANGLDPDGRMGPRTRALLKSKIRSRDSEPGAESGRKPNEPLAAADVSARHDLKKVAAAVLDQDPRNKGISVRLLRKSQGQKSVLVFDLLAVSGDNSAMDVFRVFNQAAEKIQNEHFDEIRLAYKGDVRFTIDGDYFQTLGAEYSSQNPVYTLRTFPENLYRPDGSKAFGTWSGGILGVVKEQMDDFHRFHREWYMNDLIAAAGASR